MSIYNEEGNYLAVQRPDGTIAKVPVMQDDNGKTYVAVWPNRGEGAPAGPKLTYEGPGEVARVYARSPLPPQNPKAILAQLDPTGRAHPLPHSPDGGEGWLIEPAYQLGSLRPLDLDPEGRPADRFELPDGGVEWHPIDVNTVAAPGEHRPPLGPVRILVQPDSKELRRLFVSRCVVGAFASEDPKRIHWTAVDLAFSGTGEPLTKAARDAVARGLAEAARGILSEVFEPAPKDSAEATERLASWVEKEFGAAEVAKALRGATNPARVWLDPTADPLLANWPRKVAQLVWLYRVRPELEREKTRKIAAAPIGIISGLTAGMERHEGGPVGRIQFERPPMSATMTAQLAHKKALRTVDDNDFWLVHPHIVGLVAEQLTAGLPWQAARDVYIEGGFASLGEEAKLTGSSLAGRVEEVLKAGTRARILAQGARFDEGRGLWTYLRTKHNPNKGRRAGVRITVSNAYDPNMWAGNGLLVYLIGFDDIASPIGRKSHGAQRRADNYLQVRIVENLLHSGEPDGESIVVGLDLPRELAIIETHCGVRGVDMNRWFERHLMPNGDLFAEPLLRDEGGGAYRIMGKVGRLYREQFGKRKSNQKRGRASAAKRLRRK